MSLYTFFLNRRMRKKGYIPADEIKLPEVKPGEDIHLEPLTIVATRTFDSIEEMKKVEEEEGGILRLENGWVPCEENITYLVPHQGPAHPATHK